MTEQRHSRSGLHRIYYAADGEFAFGSEAPWDPAMTTRVLTIMLASEY
ncbi:DUF3768 domain-containing protein [Novosphingobium sp. CCH12-A3]|nr:DUF3768 domain-containing protein [Novosphingobium sp. CCH12-A3]